MCYYLLTPWSRVLLEKLTGFQLVKKFPVFYGTQSFITAFTSARRLSLSQATRACPYPTPDFLKILPSTPGSPKLSLSLMCYYCRYFVICDIIHLSTLGSSNWSLIFRVSNENFTCAAHGHVHLMLFYSIMLITHVRYGGNSVPVC